MQQENYQAGWLKARLKPLDHHYIIFFSFWVWESSDDDDDEYGDDDYKVEFVMNIWIYVFLNKDFLFLMEYHVLVLRNMRVNVKNIPDTSFLAIDIFFISNF